MSDQIPRYLPCRPYFIISGRVYEVKKPLARRDWKWQAIACQCVCVCVCVCLCVFVVGLSGSFLDHDGFAFFFREQHPPLTALWNAA